MGQTVIRFIRHAEGEHMASPHIVTGRSPHAQLTDNGRRQATERGHAWRKEGFQPDCVETSPILRCSQTARIVLASARLAVAATSRDELGEMCQGSLEGTVRTAALKEQMDREGGAFRAPGYNSEGLPGESFGDVYARWRRYLASHVHEHVIERPITVAAFSHRVAIGTLLSGLLIQEEEGVAAVTAHALRERYMADRENMPIPPAFETQITLEPAADGGFVAHIDFMGRTDGVT